MNARLLCAVIATAAICISYTPRATAAGIQVQSAQWSGRKFTVCVSDTDRPAGERIQVDFFVDGYFYDRMRIANQFPAVCGEREFAPFGPRPGGHTIAPMVVDEPGGSAVALPTTSFQEPCAVFAGTNALQWCNSTQSGDVPGYYGIRQSMTLPLVSDAVWAGVTIGYGGLIQQMYSSQRNYNLLDEHAGGGMGMAMWGVAQKGVLGNLQSCNWPPPPPEGAGPPMEVVHFLFPQGANCNYGIWARWDGLTYDRGVVTGLISYLFNPEHHGRRLTLTDMHIGQMVFNRGDYLEITYGYRNVSQWDFGEHDQELPALHLNRAVNREYAWSRNEPPYYGYKAVADGEAWAARLVVPGVSPFSGAGTETWNGRWVTVCGAGRVHCVTVAPAAPPTPATINMANLRANWDVIDTPYGRTQSNQISLVGRFGIPRENTIKAHTVYVFPYAVIQPLPSGMTVLQRIQQLQQW